MKNNSKRLRNTKLADYGISKYRYRELKNFCLQYEEKKAAITYGLKAIGTGGALGSSTNSPTENNALKNSAYEQDCKIIEDAAKETSDILCKYILKGVTKDLPFEFIVNDSELGVMPVGKTEYYAYRRKFFSILNKKRK